MSNIKQILKKYPPMKYGMDYCIYGNFVDKYRDTVGEKIKNKNWEKYKKDIKIWEEYIKDLDARITVYLDEELPFYRYKKDWRNEGIVVLKHPKAKLKSEIISKIKFLIYLMNNVWKNKLKEIEMKPISFNAIWNHEINPLKEFI